MEVPELRVPKDHCNSCPTLIGLLWGHDPESHQILTTKEMFEDPSLETIYCPWRRDTCVTYREERRWARECYRLGITPPVREQGGLAYPTWLKDAPIY